jgi:hypothetical protein
LTLGEAADNRRVETPIDGLSLRLKERYDEMNRIALLAALGVASIATSATARSAPLPVSAFAYTPMPFASHAVVFTDAGDGTSRAIVTYMAGDRTLTAEIIEPTTPLGADTAPRPGALFVHWLGDDATTNHTEFEPDAVALAKRGAVCVLVDAMWSTVTNKNADWFDKIRSTDTDYANSIRQVVDLRRDLDVLLSLNVRPDRIAYVGHDFGSMYGAVLSGVDPRPSYYVLMAGNPSFARWYLLGKKPADVAAFRKQMEPLDPLPYMARSTAKGFLFQFASHDDFITPAQEAEYGSTAPLPRGVFLYKADHALNVPQARIDRLAWLESRLFP